MRRVPDSRMPREVLDGDGASASKTAVQMLIRRVCEETFVLNGSKWKRRACPCLLAGEELQQTSDSVSFDVFYTLKEIPRRCEILCRAGGKAAYDTGKKG